MSPGDEGAWIMIAQLVAAAAAGSIALLWLGGIFWVANDVRQRTPNEMTRWACVGAAALFFLPGVLAYLLLRPRETMAERAEHRMEAAMIAQQAASVPSCPSCRRMVEHDYVRCPYCAATLGAACNTCGRANMAAWVACPYCGEARAAALETAPLRTAQPAMRRLAPAILGGRNGHERAR